MLAGLLALWGGVALQASPLFRSDEVVTLQLAGTTTVERTADFAGRLYVWAESADVDPVLRIVSTTRTEAVEDDDAGGGTTACIAFAVVKGEALTLTIRSAEPDGRGAVLLHLVPAEEGDVTRAAASRARAELEAVTTLRSGGEHDAARARLEAAIDELLLVPGGEGSPAVVAALAELAFVAYDLGALDATVLARRHVVAHRERCLPPDHPDLATSRSNLAATLSSRGDVHEALELEEQLLAMQTRTLPDDHPDLCMTRLNLAATLFMLGRVERAIGLFQQVHAVYSRTLPADHFDLAVVRGNLAAALRVRGDFCAARELEERVLQALESQLPEDHPYVSMARQNLANTLESLGDYEAARELGERALATLSRILPDDHPELASARHNLSTTLLSLGDFAGALALREKVLAVRSQTLPEEHRELCIARESVASTRKALGDLAGARVLEEAVLEVYERTLAPGDVELATTRSSHANTLRRLGELDAALALHEQARAALESALPADHDDLLHALRLQLWTLVQRKDDESAVRVGLELAHGLRASAELAIRRSEPRVAEAHALALEEGLAAVLSLAGSAAGARDEALLQASFALVETVRGAALAGAQLLRAAGTDPELAPLVARMRETSAEAARLVAESAGGDEAVEAVRARDLAQRRLLESLAGRARTRDLALEVDAARLAAALPDDAASVAYWRYFHAEMQADGSLPETEVLIAFVLRPDGMLRRVELGPLAPVAAAVEAWRAALGVHVAGRGVGVVETGTSEPAERACGAAVRQLVLDPLRPLLGEARRLVVVADDVLHLVALDALPSDAGDERLLGDELRIEQRATLRELLAGVTALEPQGLLLAAGGVEYAASDEGEAASVTALAADASAAPQRVARAGAWDQGFGALPATAREVAEIAALARSAGERPARVLAGKEATKAALAGLAPEARFVHLATHGYFAPESIPSTSDPRPIDLKLGFGVSRSSRERAHGLSPMILCGLALAGANGAGDAYGRVGGLVTAEELATFDLSRCALAVLSACDTNVGIRRAGQGVASLQKALHMAGAQSVITSLWKVPDEATRELMVDFYRRLWVEKQPMGQALWEAKLRMRQATDAAGRPAYSTRDWAAWVLSGDSG